MRAYAMTRDQEILQMGYSSPCLDHWWPPCPTKGPHYTMHMDISINASWDFWLCYGSNQWQHHQTGTARPTVMWQWKCLCHEGLYHSAMWALLMTYGLGYASNFKYMGSEKGPFNLLFWVLHTGTQFGSHTETMGQNQGDSNGPSWLDRSSINLISLEIKKYTNIKKEKEDKLFVMYMNRYDSMIWLLWEWCAWWGTLWHLVWTSCQCVTQWIGV